MKIQLIIVSLTLFVSCVQPTQIVDFNQLDDKDLIILQDTVSTNSKHEDYTSDSNESSLCVNYRFNSAEERADSLQVFMRKAKNSDSFERLKWELKFFCAFPDSFEEMQSVFGFDDIKGTAPLYEYPNGANAIEFFGKINSVPDSIYYDKYVRINIGGFWEADNIAEAFYFANRLIVDTEKACKSLAKFSDDEIKSVFRFIFDGPHPRNDYNEEKYQKLKLKIGRADMRLNKLLKLSYESLITGSGENEH
jgi:hypothetical protein